ncbi:TetR/AcrR family transcriptional regulator [Rhodococcus sp. G-MC3]|uniref:TetR/AcrR family transcriptional regulator n=1 Tax=Rhodococcus sp. G-MC3 TaxID=3046209 RepID=UPI0024B9DD9A|nr:TetR/AcrR family transcriptional regulator [Rhodococcus sp. G-MC3]MDJ0395383.1 TetR/AcrR family transcriptional regulator [Rhodococcus sp. G-MC3]
MNANIDTGTGRSAGSTPVASGRSAGSTPVQRRRPKDRKAQILTAAAEAFSERGYHAVGIDDIAATLDISGPALYRHFPTKYALFVHTVMRLAGTLLAATDLGNGSADPREQVDAVMLAIIDTTIDNRRTGGLYRWEGRYLLDEDRIALRESVTILNERVRTPLLRLRPELSEADASTIAAAAISVVASITAHRSMLSAKQIESLMLSTARNVLAADLPESIDAPAPDIAEVVHGSKREALLHEAILLFYRHGYHSVSIEDIGAAAGINASSVYRHFASKADLLAAAFHRASDGLTVALDEALARSRTPEEAVETLVYLYVELSFERSELMAVYFAEIGNLPKDQRSTLRNLQRLNIEKWAQLVSDARPEIGAMQARFLVHAALGLVFDMGRLVHFDLAPGPAGRVRQLMLTTLFG